MLEARIAQGMLLKKLIDSIKDLVEESNFDCSSTAISLQAMDSSHVALVAILLKADAFDHYRADRPVSLGINIVSLSKIFKCLGSNDSITLRATDDAETIELVFETEDQDRISNFELKLMDIDSEHLDVPDTRFTCTVSMPSNEFQRICRDLNAIGDTIKISASKGELTFSVDGDIGKGAITCRQSSAVDEDEEKVAVAIKCDDPVELQFSMNYLIDFTRATSLSKTVNLHMASDVPIMIEYPIEDLGHLRFFLAPKMEGEEE